MFAAVVVDVAPELVVIVEIVAAASEQFVAGSIGVNLLLLHYSRSQYWRLHHLPHHLHHYLQVKLHCVAMLEL